METNRKLIQIVIPGQPIPAKRVTGRCLWRAKAYADYKEMVAWELKKLRLGQIDGDCSIQRMTFYREKNRRADLDNLLKSIMEAFQMSGIVKNDSQVVFIKNLSVQYKSDKPRVEIEF